MLTLGTLVVVIIMFLSGKANFGFIGMCCAAFMCASGVLTFDEAYENFASNNIIMMCGMFVLAGALNKTSLVKKCVISSCQETQAAGPSYSCI